MSAVSKGVCNSSRNIQFYIAGRRTGLYMDKECQFCRVAEATEPDRFLCDHCTPDDCEICGARLEYNEVENKWFCVSNGHMSDPFDVTDRLYEERFEYSRKKKIKFAGPRTEAIIPDSSSITDIQREPDDLNPTSDELVLYHGTRSDNVDEILDEGLKSLSELGKTEDLNDSYEGSIRYDAVFGWPFTPQAGPSDYEFSEYVYFTVPFDSVTVSSYSYLECVQFGSITLDEYEKEYCFGPEEFLEVCKDSGRPYSRDELLQFK